MGLISDYMTKLLLKKPENIYNYTKEYFKFLSKKDIKNKIKPLIICAPSGCGKGTLIKKLIKNYPHYFKLSVSYTTRQPRKEDIDGVTYNFVDKDKFSEEINNNNFIEYVEYNGNYYGTNYNYINNITNKGQICVIEIEIEGAKKIYSYGLECNYIYILPPNIEELRKRLIKRNSENIDIIEKRIDISKSEIEQIQHLKFFDKIFVNDNFDLFYQQ